MIDVLDTPLPARETLDGSEIVVDLQDIVREYAGTPSVRALGPASLRVARGEYAAVMGPSGSGKSTLLNLVGLLDRPTDGGYRFDGVDTHDLDEAARTGLRGARIGFVFQSFHLLPRRTATENVALALLYGGVERLEREQRARAVLERVGLGHRLDSNARTLSGGEQQRVAIARALVSGPALLLCDEPTGSLDQATGTAVLDLLDELHREGMTILVITHDPSVGARAGRIVRLRDGLITDGNQ